MGTNELNEWHENQIRAAVDTSVVPTIARISKCDIEHGVATRIAELLVEHDSAELYVFFKQLEFIAKEGIETLKAPALTAFMNRNGGATSGTVLGHKVQYRSAAATWQYPQTIVDMEEYLKTQKKIAQLDGTATKTEGGATLSITLS